MLVDGRVGSVDTHVAFQQVHEAGRVQGFVADGTLGGEDYRLDARLSGVERKNEEGRPSHLEGDFLVRGKVGSHQIIKMYISPR